LTFVAGPTSIGAEPKPANCMISAQKNGDIENDTPNNVAPMNQPAPPRAPAIDFPKIDKELEGHDLR
jgi:hypothetical protein